MKVEKNEILPLGSVVYLKGGTVKVEIIGRGAVFENKGHNEYSDYMGIEYPAGFDPDNGLFFNNEDIDEVLFKGFTDDEEDRFRTLYRQWEKNIDVPKKKSADNNR